MNFSLAKLAPVPLSHHFVFRNSRHYRYFTCLHCLGYSREIKISFSSKLGDRLIHRTQFFAEIFPVRFVRFQIRDCIYLFNRKLLNITYIFKRPRSPSFYKLYTFSLINYGIVYNSLDHALFVYFVPTFIICLFAWPTFRVDP